jgi:NAD(P)-dependent dehydrogenase (short-subunit alcohol dehydrogenase family)
MIKGFTAADVPSQTGRTFLVTGANTGLGFEVAQVLAGRGGRVLLGCRTRRASSTSTRAASPACAPPPSAWPRSPDLMSSSTTPAS